MAYGYYSGNGNNGVSGNGMQMPAVYQNGSYGMQPTVPQVSYQAPPPASPMPGTLIWVDGEVGARAWQFPQGWPVNTPVALWDLNDYVIYLKSTNGMGIPNPLQKVHYTMDEVQQPMLMAGQSSAPAPAQPAMADYVTKDDMKSMEERIMAAFSEHRGRSETGANTQQQQKGGANR